MLNSTNHSIESNEGYNPAILLMLGLAGIVAKDIAVTFFGLAINPRKIFPEKVCKAAIYATSAFCTIRENIIKVVAGNNKDESFLSVVIIAPIMEELVFNFIQKTLLKDLPFYTCSYLGLEAPNIIINPVLRIMSSSILFGMIHVQYWDRKEIEGGITGTTATGFLFGAIRENFGVTPAIALHSFFNFSARLKQTNEEPIAMR